MEEITGIYLARAELWLGLTTLIYFLMNGAQIFETCVFVPRWIASAPDNFKLLVDGQGVGLKVFWIVFHSIHELAFILAIVFCWEIDSVRNWLLILFVIHFAVRVWTILYFAPAIISFQKVAEQSICTKDLKRETRRWQALNYVRVGIFILLSFGLVPLCMKLFSLHQ